jgi:alcohol dehydrogenase class IV
LPGVDPLSKVLICKEMGVSGTGRAQMNAKGRTMLPFKFQMQTKILFGPDALAQLPIELASLGDQKALVVTDQGIIRAGLLERFVSLLGEAGIAFDVFDEIEPNPKDTTILRGGECARASGADAIVALGGGSPMDAAKAIAVMAANEGPIERYCGAGVDP